MMELMNTWLVFLLCMISLNEITCLYFPSLDTKITVRFNSIPDNLTRVTALSKSGDPATAVYSVSSDVRGHPLPDSLLEVDSQGVISWREKPPVPTNLTAKVKATFKDSTAETEIQVFVLPALKNNCKPPIEELCWAEGTTFQVSEDARERVAIVEIGPTSTPCGQPRPAYALHEQANSKRAVKGEQWAAVLEGRTLKVNPQKMRGELRLTLECLKDKKSSLKNITVKLIPSSVHLPIVPGGNSHVVQSITKGSHLLLTWMVVKTGTKAEWLPPVGKHPAHTVRIEKYNFRTRVVNATLLLMNLTWDEDFVPKHREINLTVSVSVCPDQGISSCRLQTWSHISIGDSPPVVYPRGPVRISPSPFARVAQPNNTRNLSASLIFRSPLPSVMESPFKVTEVAGIVYLRYWDSPELVKIPGLLVEWTRNGTGVGLAWISVKIADTDCGGESNWAVCSESVNERSCVSTCGLAASPSRQGYCQWKSNLANVTWMSRNYFTCSTDLGFCPDRWCDPLEQLDAVICSQDCTTTEVMLGRKDTKGGIASGIGICTCDSTGKCHCGPVHKKATSPKNQPHQGVKPPSQRTQTLTSNFLVKEDPQPFCDFHCIIFLFAVGISIMLILVLSVYFIAYRGCNFRNKSRASAEYSAHALLPITGQEVRTPVEAINNMNQYDIDPKWEFPRSRLMVEECLGEGEFGRVLKATARDLPGCQGFMTVAVKTLKENAGSSELDDLMSEYQLLKEVSHPNVIKLLGACTAPGGPVYIIIEFCGLGSLRAYLRRHRNIITNSEAINNIQKLDEITPRDILSFAWQISKGMAYLTEIKLVHRDLAARNILLATGKVCKISDFGLTRDVYEDDTYLKKSRGRVPVKWMAPESLSDHIYTSKSDVWSFGVVLWELVTLGSAPYPGIAAQNLYHLLKSGYRMQRPHNCSEQLYDIMKDCWSGSPSERPSFAYLVDKFERMLEEGSDYLDCNIKMVTNPAYFETEEGLETSGNEMDIKFTMDLSAVKNCEEEWKKKYENEMINKNTSYDTPKPISCIVMSELLMKDEQR